VEIVHDPVFSSTSAWKPDCIYSSHFLEFALSYKRMFTIVFLSNYMFMPMSTFYHYTYLLKLILTQQLTFCFVIFFEELECNMYRNNLGNTMDEPVDSVTSDLVVCYKAVVNAVMNLRVLAPRSYRNNQKPA
jgi:hypothetical protein